MKKITKVGLLMLGCSLVFAEDGFLSESELPNSKEILPPPPITETYNITPEFAQDQEITKTLFQDKAYFTGEKISYNRLYQATEDANKSTEYFLHIFIDPLDISEQNKRNITTFTSDIVTKVILDGNNSTKKAKEAYGRSRPYYYYDTVSCEGADSSSEKRNLSYPSGHTSRGMTVAYVLADILPERYRERILSRGMDYANSRVICGAHWQSDIEAGRVLSRSVFEHLQKNDNFNREIENAKHELRSLE